MVSALEWVFEVHTSLETKCILVHHADDTVGNLKRAIGELHSAEFAELGPVRCTRLETPLPAGTPRDELYVIFDKFSLAKVVKGPQAFIFAHLEADRHLKRLWNSAEPSVQPSKKRALCLPALHDGAVQPQAHSPSDSCSGQALAGLRAQAKPALPSPQASPEAPAEQPAFPRAWPADQAAEQVNGGSGGSAEKQSISREEPQVPGAVADVATSERIAVEANSPAGIRPSGMAISYTDLREAPGHSGPELEQGVTTGNQAQHMAAPQLEKGGTVSRGAAATGSVDDGESGSEEGSSSEDESMEEEEEEDQTQAGPLAAPVGRTLGSIAKVQQTLPTECPTAQNVQPSPNKSKLQPQQPAEESGSSSEESGTSEEESDNEWRADCDARREIRKADEAAPMPQANGKDGAHQTASSSGSSEEEEEEEEEETSSESEEEESGSGGPGKEPGSGAAATPGVLAKARDLYPECLTQDAETEARVHEIAERDGFTHLLQQRSARKFGVRPSSPAEIAGAQETVPSTPGQGPAAASPSPAGQGAASADDAVGEGREGRGRNGLKPLREYSSLGILRKAVREALRDYVNLERKGRGLKPTQMVYRDVENRPTWWPFSAWDHKQLDKSRANLEQIYKHLLPLDF